jgi:hypothetical protein
MVSDVSATECLVKKVGGLNLPYGANYAYPGHRLYINMLKPKELCNRKIQLSVKHRPLRPCICRHDSNGT